MLGPILRGSLVTLRPPTPEEAKTFIAWFADVEVTRYIAVRFPPALHQEEEFLKRMSESRDDVFWVIEVGARPVGAIGIHGINWISAHAITGIAIGDKSYWRRGVATESMQLRTRYAFRELNLHKLMTSVVIENVGSRRALEKAGYRTIGVLRQHHWSEGRYHDMWLGEVLREDWEREHGGD